MDNLAPVNKILNLISLKMVQLLTHASVLVASGQPSYRYSESLGPAREIFAKQSSSLNIDLDE